MKILNIYFKNIKSLEGVNRVNFEQSPFTDSGVFAITGPNGSGKSSILDAITLGLYGETFRFDRPAMHVMTKHTSESFSEIEFALGKDKYRSSWHVRREAGNPQGELLPAEMKLLQLNGTEEILAETPHEVCSRITDITGMNFRNFTRSILLAQGDFAAFLNALDNERMDILEKIVGSDVYADYKKELTDKLKNAETRLENLEQDLSLLALIEPEKLEACEQDLGDFIEQYDSLYSELTTLQQQQHSLQKIEVLRDQVAGLEIEIRQAEDKSSKNREKLAKIASFPEALSYQDDLTLINEKKQAVDDAKDALLSYRNELKQLETVFVNAGVDKEAPEGIEDKSIFEQQEAILDIRAEMSRLDALRYSESMKLQSLTGQINEKKAALDNVAAWMEAHPAEAALVENFPDIIKLKNLRAEKTGLADKKKSFAQLSKTTTSALKDQKTTLEKENARLERLKSELESEQKYLEELSQGKSLNEIEELRSEQKIRVDSFNELVKLAEAYRKMKGYGGGLLGLFKSKELFFRSPDDLESELGNLRLEIKREENIAFILEASVAREALMKRMEQDRHQLIEGKPCPLCGSLDHPYVQKPPVVSNSQQALADQQEKLKRLRFQLEKREQELAVSKTQAEKNRTTNLELQRISSQWSSLTNRLNIMSTDLSIDNLKLMDRLREKEEADLKDIVFLAAKYRNRQNSIEKLKVSITKSADRIDQLQADYQRREAEWQERPDEQKELEKSLNQCQQEEADLTAKVEEQLAAAGEKMPAKGKEVQLFDRLNERCQEYQTYMIHRDNLKEEIRILSDKQAAADSEINSCNEKIHKLDALLKNEEIIGLHLALIEKQKLIAQQQQLITQLEAETQNRQRSLLEKVQETPFNTLNLLAEIIELHRHKEQLERQSDYLDQLLESRTDELRKNWLELDAEKAVAETDSTLEEINAQLKTVSEKLDIVNFEIRHLENLLSEQQQLRLRYEAFLPQVEEQREVVRQCKVEASLLTAGMGMEFRRKVQARIAERLLFQTNSVLEKISGRYYLRQQPNEQGLALAIEDTYQDNISRLPKSLSGGETFIVSLALALGLSEMASNGKSVDSLFIDEGFGSLDAENLYTVISTLEGLRTHGKIVGVISHVESVQKRIKAQLQVVMKPNGMGMLKKAS